MIEILKIISKLLDAINPQKNLDEHYERITKAKSSQKHRERELSKVTTVKLLCDCWVLLLVTWVIIAGSLYYLGIP
jgi:hypothetical protein